MDCSEISRRPGFETSAKRIFSVVTSVVGNDLGTSPPLGHGFESSWLAPRPADERSSIRSSDQDPKQPDAVVSRHTDDDMERMYFRYKTISPVGVEYVSDAFALFLGYPASSFHNDHQLLMRLPIDADRKRLAAYLSNVGPARPSIEVSWRSRSNGIVQLKLNARTIQTEDGRVVALDVTVRPVMTVQSRDQPHLKLFERLTEAFADPDSSVETQLTHLADWLVEFGADFSLLLCDPGNGNPAVIAKRCRNTHPAVRSALDRIAEDRLNQQSIERRDHSTTSSRAGQARVDLETGHDWLDVAEAIPSSSIEVMTIEGPSGTIGAVFFGAAPNNPAMTPEILRLSRILVQTMIDRIERNLLRDAVRNLSRSRDRLLSTVAHELKTPLTSIRGYSQLLTRYLSHQTPDIVRSRRAVSGLETQVNRFMLLSEELLDAARMNQGKLDLHVVKVDLIQVARTVSERVGEVESTEGSRIILNTPRELAGMWDVARIDQLIEILLSNALRYSVDRDVHFKVECDDQEVVLSISDRGIGIDAEDLERVFEPFERGRVAAGMASGSGLGLYRAQEIARHHGGGMEIESRPNDGTTVTVRLPIDCSSMQS